VSRVGEQLALSLDDVRLQIPWNGVSPRVLTAAYARFTLKAQAAKSTSDLFSDGAQLDLLERQKDRPLYEGAVPLLPLPWEAKHG